MHKNGFVFFFKKLEKLKIIQALSQVFYTGCRTQAGWVFHCAELPTELRALVKFSMYNFQAKNCNEKNRNSIKHNSSLIAAIKQADSPLEGDITYLLVKTYRFRAVLSRVHFCREKGLNGFPVFYIDICIVRLELPQHVFQSKHRCLPKNTNLTWLFSAKTPFRSPWLIEFQKIKWKRRRQRSTGALAICGFEIQGEIAKKLEPSTGSARSPMPLLVKAHGWC